MVQEQLQYQWQLQIMELRIDTVFFELLMFIFYFLKSKQLISVQIQMFQELKDLLAAENIRKIRQTQRLLQKSSDYDEFDAQDSWISQDDQLSQRMQIFKTLMSQNQRDRPSKRTQNTILSNKASKLAKQKQLLEQKLIIQRQNYERQITYLKDKQQRELKTLKVEIEKYQYRQKKLIKQEGVLLALRKENRQLVELQSQCSENMEKMVIENGSLKKQIIELKIIIKQKEEKETILQAEQLLESQNEKSLKQTVAKLVDEKNTEVERRKQMQTSVSRLKLEVEDLSREVDRLKLEKNHEKIQESQKWKAEIVRIQQENQELKKRNQKLEQSFLEHLTQTSLNLQHSLKNQPDRTAKNTTLYLQETPIKSRSREKQVKSPEEEDPEKNQCEAKRCDCQNHTQKLKVKLRQANAKIVELLQQKCSSYRQR